MAKTKAPMQAHKKYPLARDINLCGYRTLKAGTPLEVVRVNSRYVFCAGPGDPGGLTFQLTRKDFGR